LLQEEPGPSVQRDNLLPKGPELKPPHRVPSYRVSRAAHGSKGEAGAYKFDVEMPESNLF